MKSKTKLEVVKKILKHTRMKGRMMRFPYYNVNDRLVYADVTLNIKWNQD